MRRCAPLRLVAALFALSLLAASCGEDDPTPTVDAGQAGADPADDPGDADGHADGDPADDHADDHADGDHDHDHDADNSGDAGDTMGDAGHAHEGTVEAGDPAPTVTIAVDPDPAGGINVHVETTGFTVDPAAAGHAHVDGVGHYHLMIDGEKVLRFYNDAIYYAGVTEGEVEVEVVLSTNDHRTYTVDGEPVSAALTVVVPPHSHTDHSHAEPEPVAWEGDPPSLGLRVEPDPVAGWNAFVEVEGLTLSADGANGDHVPGEGHLHLFANGQKLGRLYGPATHLAVLPSGEVEVAVEAYTNDHRPYVVDGEPVRASVMVAVAS